MVVAVTEEHIELAHVARSFFAVHGGRAAARASLEGEGEVLPPFWTDMAALEWFGLHLPEEYGGSGYGLPELAVVVDEMGYVCAPGPFLATVVASAAIAAAGTPGQCVALLPDLADAARVAALGLDGSLTVGAGGSIDGDAGPVIGAGTADLLVLAAGGDLWIVDRESEGVAVQPHKSLDATRRVSRVICSDVSVPEDRVVRGGAERARWALDALGAAEAAGAATACVDMASDYAKERIAFGRPIGQFQAIKHHCANMLLAAQMAAAAAWNAARAASQPGEAPFATSIAVATAVSGLLQCAKANVQIHGGIGFTWEHDAQLFLRRAGALRALLGTPGNASARVAKIAASGAIPDVTLDLPYEAESLRPELRAFVDGYCKLPDAERQAAIVDGGYLYPHWPPPWGRSASPLEQVVIDQELEPIPRMAALGPTGWTLPIVLPSIMAHGTDDQKKRWIRPTMLGEVTWCQLFSEPGAGSDLASLTTRAERDTGGWRVTGQKVWTSSAQHAAFGFALVRTDAAAAKHAGITCMVIDMTADGVEVRPLRDLTGEQHFNEVFLDEVFVPDDDVLGEVNRGWAVARTTLGNERVFLGGRRGLGMDDAVVALAIERGGDDPDAMTTLGELIATGHTLQLLNLRAATRAVIGGEPGPEGNVAKLVAAERDQRLADFALGLLGPEGVFADGNSEIWAAWWLRTRQLTIAGGTSEIVRNVIAERILGLPRDPSAK